MNNSQEFQSNQLKREQMLQQIILDQKQRIRELEQIESNPPLKVQHEIQAKSSQIQELREQLQVCQSQLSQSQEKQTELQNEYNSMEKQFLLLKNEQEIMIQKEVAQIEAKLTVKVNKLENENALLQQQLEQAQPMYKALNNYTSEETYIEQVEQLQQFLNSYQKQYLSEIIHYKRAAELTRQNSELQSARLVEEKKNLQKQLDDVIKVDQQIQEDVIIKLTSAQGTLDKLSVELKKSNEAMSQQVNKNYEELQQTCQKGFQAETTWLKEKAILTKFPLSRNIYQLQLVIPDFEEKNILKQEKALLEDALQDMKLISLQREKAFIKEIEQCKRQSSYLVQQSSLREQKFENEIQKLQQSVLLLEKSYDSREQYVRQDHIQDLLDEFRNIIQELKSNVPDKRTMDIIKECKDLIVKLSRGGKSKPIEKLEKICKDLQKMNSKQCEEVKSLIIEVSRNILDDRGLLDQAIRQLEMYITTPSKRVDELLHQFHHNLQLLQSAREQYIHGQVKSIQYLDSQKLSEISEREEESLRQLEKAAHQKELQVVVQKSSRMLDLYEASINNLKQQVVELHKIIQQQDTKYNESLQQQESQFNQLKSQVLNYAKVVNDLQQQRLNERKELIKMVKESEDHIIQQYKQQFQLIHKTLETIQGILDKKTKILKKREAYLKQQHLSNDLQPILLQAQEDLKLLQQKDRDRDDRYQQELAIINKSLEDLRTNITHLHQEKGTLIEQMEALNNVLQTQKKLYYSFRQ